VRSQQILAQRVRLNCTQQIRANKYAEIEPMFLETYWLLEMPTTNKTTSAPGASVDIEPSSSGSCAFMRPGRPGVDIGEAVRPDRHSQCAADKASDGRKETLVGRTRLRKACRHVPATSQATGPALLMKLDSLAI